MDRVYDLTCEYLKNPAQIDVVSPRFAWKIEAEGMNVIQVKWKITVKLSALGEVVWEKEEESNRTVHIEYQGEPLLENRKYVYQVESTLSDGRVLVSGGEDCFETGIFSQDAWKGIWIGKKDREDLGNCPLFRKVFAMDKKLFRARIFISARGLYELSVNGRVMDEYVFAPGWTNYHVRQQYLAYDVTEFLNTGVNCIGVRLGDGWYDGEISFNHQTHSYGEAISFAAILQMEYADGTEEVLKTDTSWKTAESGILKSTIYDGEIYDLTREASNWNRGEFDESSWGKADLAEDTDALMIGMRNEGTKRIQTVQGVTLFQAPNGETLIDMGQNMTGWVRITVQAKAGEKIVIKHCETLDKEGNFYSGNLRLAMQQDTYILREGHNVLEPHFTFHGFRYLKIVQFPGKPALDQFEGIVLHTAMEAAMEFECSNPLVNRLWQNLVWGQKGNFLDVPTDCPQRDERLGWTGDAQVFCRTACYNFHADPFFTKWLEDVKADQYVNGAVPFVVPDVLPKDWRFMMDAGLGPGHTSAVWGDVITIAPWALYECYGDKRILEETYDNMKRYLSYIYDGACHGSGDPYLWDWGPQLGDWLGLDSQEGSYRGGTDEKYVATVFYAHSADIVSKCAKILGQEQDQEYYNRLYKKIVEHFRQRYIQKDEIIIATQTAQILPLQFGLLSKAEEEKALEQLTRLLKESSDHLKTGFAGTPYLCHVLSKYGRGDLAYQLLLQEDFPSWLYQVTQGATTVWEHWDGKKPDGSFWSDDMNSFNHYAYGSIGEWLYRFAAGIDTDWNAPGFGHILLHPQTNAALTFVDCRYESIRGKIVSRWERKDSLVKYHVEIPANTSAEVILDHGQRYEIGSGSYEYEWRTQ